MKHRVRGGYVKRRQQQSSNQCVALQKGCQPYACLLKRQLHPKLQIPCFCGFVFWRQYDSVLITILEHEGGKEMQKWRGRRKETTKQQNTAKAFGLKQKSFESVYILCEQDNPYVAVCSCQMHTESEGN